MVSGVTIFSVLEPSVPSTGLIPLRELQFPLYPKKGLTLTFVGNYSSLSSELMLLSL